MKVFKILHKLRKPEISRFHQFINSPYFNQRKDVIRLLEEWISSKGKRQLPRNYWQSLFTEEKFSNTKWYLLTSRLFKLLEEFLIIEEVRTKSTDKKFYLAKGYRKRKEVKLFEKAITDSSYALEKQGYRNMDYLQGMHDLAYKKYDYIISINRKEKSNLQEVSDYFNDYVISAKLRQACYARSREIINQEKTEIKLLDEIILEIEGNPSYLETPSIAIYYYCYKAISAQDDESYFRKLRSSLHTFNQYFPPSEMRDIYTAAINVSIRKLNTGNKAFAREAYELYLQNLQQGFLLDDGILLESAYSNIVSLAIKLGLYDWAIQFSKDYQQHLKPIFQIPFFHFNLGKIYYEKGQLENSLKELILVDTKASYIFLAARTLQLKIYYELGEIDPLESLLESLRVYIQRSKDLAYRKAHYSNIITFTRLLLQMPAMNKEEKQNFRNRVENAGTFGEKDWFLEKIG